MDVQVKYVVCGVTDGFGWHLPTWYDTVEEANTRAEHEAAREDDVWVEKHTTTREIIRARTRDWRNGD